jgi:hypothetical protein
MADLIRDRDGEGFSGSNVQALDPKDLSNVVGHEPMVGYCLRVGSVTAGMFSTRDWWMTTPIVEIVSTTDDEIKFKTANSSYTFRR